jgi:hypothetical protein
MPEYGSRAVVARRQLNNNLRRAQSRFRIQLSTPPG